MMLIHGGRILNGAMLNQSSQSVTERYAHLQAEALRGLVDEHSEMIKEIVKKEWFFVIVMIVGRMRTSSFDH